MSFDSLAGFRDAVRRAVAEAADRSQRHLLWVDRDFADWPLDDRALIDGLTRLLRQPRRRLTMLGARFDEFAGRQPRFFGWYRHFAHGVEVAQVGDELAPRLPCVLLGDTDAVIQVVDRERWRGECSNDPERRKALLEQIDALLQHSTPALPATTLGL